MQKRDVEQKLMIVEENGHSRPLSGDLEENRFGKAPEDLMPSHLSIGWRVINMTSMGSGTSVLVLLEREMSGR
jgi:hypothetical protein